MRSACMLCLGVILAIIAAAFLFAIPVTVNADGEMALPEAEAIDGWFVWPQEIGGSRAGLTSADMDSITDHLENIAQVMRRSSALVNGAEIAPSRAIGHGRGLGLVQPAPTSYRLDMRIYRPSMKEARSSGGNMSILINAPHIAADYLFADAEGPIHIARPVVGEVAGFPVYLLSAERARARETGWVTTSDGRFPWVPVSKERWIRALIGDAKGKLTEFEREVNDEAQQRRTRFEHSYEGMKKISTENAEKLREQFETRERLLRQIKDALREGDHKAMEKLGRRDLAMLGQAALRLEEELAAMPPKQRGAPAYCCEAPPSNYFAPPRSVTRPSLLLEPDDKRAGALLAPKTDFFRNDLPRTAIQSITVIQRIARPDEAWEVYLDEVRKRLDWKAMALLLMHDTSHE
jgi:hypothetical protein